MDWDDAYQNGAYIENAGDYIPMWQAASQAFQGSVPKARKNIEVAYGPNPREVYDLFLPEGPAKGVVIFIHGGFWRAFDQSYWSHLAAGPMAHGWAVALPGYPLCPEVSIADITQSMVRAVGKIGDAVDGDIIIAGHSAGGHLTARMACEDIALPHAKRVRRYVSISGVHDLRPLIKTDMNDDFKLTLQSAAAESPALCTPRGGVELLAWVGANERPEFLRQNDLLANIWRGAFAETGAVHAKDQHHFDVIAALAEAQSPLTRSLIA